MSATSQITQVLEGIPTDVVIQPFADRIFVLITQLGKVGSLIEATIPEATPLLPPPPPPPESSEVPLPVPPAAINLKPLLGVAPSEHLETLYSLYAAQVATLVWTIGGSSSLGDTRRAVIVGIALKRFSGGEGNESVGEQERRVFRGAMRTLRDLLVQS
ncbi:hypothetical protein PHLGIDRAFT_102801 [Phlebiopsis gigantea 11061_1 CR5-6]|uniref:Proteasome assembly chaperone 3 n=1 Tax=Phlebiopsis gigantea (strain 11061_1 CR5-6) TaxID=745531 RepID=A0A0C3S2K3_PHLG1|nr:hypothetical protein PHLGIDRAFT_102801 [Phlebiopsis gigantea 11061_1 CR5-6]